VRLFLDTSVLLAAAGSATGAPRFLIESATAQCWRLISADYCGEEARRNLSKLPKNAVTVWRQLIVPRLDFVKTDVVLDRPLIFAKLKDRPVLVSSLAQGCDWLLTYDETDFHEKLGPQIYGMRISTPGEFLHEQRHLGRI
jgi:predicted nucleic acid-binding protein